MVISYYDNDFFDHVTSTAKESAARIVPWLTEVARPMSVLDVGCGEGVWLAAFKNQGVEDIFGIDGDYVDRQRLKVPTDKFRAEDLSKNVMLDRSFDLAICLEVAEHLSLESADALVHTLVDHAPVILFSAAIPLQQGTDHRNEQWPSYWITKFIEHNYAMLDVVRPHFWEDEAVAVWYRQNTFIYAKKGNRYADQIIYALGNNDSFHGQSIVHPNLWTSKNGAMAARVGDSAGPRELLAKLPNSTLRAISRRIGNG